jgi:hypothetical protein
MSHFRAWTRRVPLIEVLVLATVVELLTSIGCSGHYTAEHRGVPVVAPTTQQSAQSRSKPASESAHPNSGMGTQLESTHPSPVAVDPSANRPRSWKDWCIVEANKELAQWPLLFVSDGEILSLRLRKTEAHTVEAELKQYSESPDADVCVRRLSATLAQASISPDAKEPYAGLDCSAWGCDMTNLTVYSTQQDESRLTIAVNDNWSMLWVYVEGYMGTDTICSYGFLRNLRLATPKDTPNLFLRQCELDERRDSEAREQLKRELEDFRKRQPGNR